MIKQQDTVIFDIDDTMGFFTTSFDTWLAERCQVEVPDRNKFIEYDLMAPFRRHVRRHVTALQALQDFEDTGRMSDPHYFKPTSVVKLAKQLQDAGVNTFALTARAWMKDGHKTTRDWLAGSGIQMPVYVLGLHDSKAEWINKNIADNRGEHALYGKKSFDSRPKVWLFEDNPSHISDVSNACLHVEKPFVVDHPHNRKLSPTLFNRVDPHSTDWIPTWHN